MLKWSQGVPRGPKGSQGVPRDPMSIFFATSDKKTGKSMKELDPKGSQGVPRGPEGSQGVPRGPKGSKGILRHNAENRHRKIHKEMDCDPQRNVSRSLEKVWRVSRSTGCIDAWIKIHFIGLEIHGKTAIHGSLHFHGSPQARIGIAQL